MTSDRRELCTEIEELIRQDHRNGRRAPLIEYLRRSARADQERIIQTYLAVGTRLVDDAANAPPPTRIISLEILDPAIRRQRCQAAAALSGLMRSLRACAGIAPLLSVAETPTGLDLSFPEVVGTSLRDHALKARLIPQQTSTPALRLSSGVAGDAALEVLAGTLAIVEQAARLVDALHQAGVVHGALSMDAVLVRSNGAIVLMDCGLGSLQADLVPTRHTDVIGLGRLLRELLVIVAGSGGCESRMADDLAHRLHRLARLAEQDPIRMPSVAVFVAAIDATKLETERSLAGDRPWKWPRRLFGDDVE